MTHPLSWFTFLQISFLPSALGSTPSSLRFAVCQWQGGDIQCVCLWVAVEGGFCYWQHMCIPWQLYAPRILGPKEDGILTSSYISPDLKTTFVGAFGGSCNSVETTVAMSE